MCLNLLFKNLTFSPSTVNALGVLGAKTLRTDQDGAISVDEALKIRTKRNDWWNISWG